MILKMFCQWLLRVFIKGNQFFTFSLWVDLSMGKKKFRTLIGEINLFFWSGNHKMRPKFGSQIIFQTHIMVFHIDWYQHSFYSTVFIKHRKILNFLLKSRITITHQTIYSKDSIAKNRINAVRFLFDLKFSFQHQSTSISHFTIPLTLSLILNIIIYFGRALKSMSITRVVVLLQLHIYTQHWLAIESIELETAHSDPTRAIDKLFHSTSRPQQHPSGRMALAPMDDRTIQEDGDQQAQEEHLQTNPISCT